MSQSNGNFSEEDAFESFETAADKSLHLVGDNLVSKMSVLDMISGPHVSGRGIVFIDLY